MKFCLLPALLLLATGALTQDGFDLFDALDDVEPTPPKPKEQPKPPANPDDGGLDLLDAFGPDEPEEKPKKPQPNPGNSDGFGFDLEDALNPDPNAKPDRPAVNPHKPSGGGGSFDDNDLFDVGDSGNYKPDGGRSGDSGYNYDGGADQPQEAGSGAIAGIVSAVGMALLGAASSYFAYQKKKLCFKIQGGADPESGKTRHPAQSNPQVYSNLLRTS
ncbi:CD99 molecule isoform X1 [Hippocampus comes]|uniref:CD99 antigen-like protein 2 n=1 Tax=Hippocampus comes TaxID=109280 RepID=A0A3Q2YBM2_HIPCM|nr:PREDICTED: CD99 antigen-like protein 2 isoform X1 [Hippocampus comes]